MNTIVTTAALQPFTRALTPAHVLPTRWHVGVDLMGAVRLRKAAAAAAIRTGPLAWSPPPC